MNGPEEQRGLRDRVVNLEAGLDYLVRYVNEAVQSQMNRIAALEVQIHGNVPVPAFPPFHEWLDMQRKREASRGHEQPRDAVMDEGHNGSLAALASETRQQLKQRPGAADFLGRRD